MKSREWPDKQWLTINFFAIKTIFGGSIYGSDRTPIFSNEIKCSNVPETASHGIIASIIRWISIVGLFREPPATLTPRKTEQRQKHGEPSREPRFQRSICLWKFLGRYAFFIAHASSSRGRKLAGEIDMETCKKSYKKKKAQRIGNLRPRLGVSALLSRPPFSFSQTENDLFYRFVPHFSPALLDPGETGWTIPMLLLCPAILRYRLLFGSAQEHCRSVKKIAYKVFSEREILRCC